MNKWQGIGRVTKDIELRQTQSGHSVASFTVAINRRNKDDGADFISCVAWGKTAEIISKYVSKGNRIGISGRIQTRQYERNGQKVYTTEVVVEEFEFLESRNQQESKPKQVDEYYEDFEEIDEDLPF